MDATVQKGSLGLMYHLVLQLPASLCRLQFTYAPYQQNPLLVGPVIHLAGYICISWSCNVLHYWHATVRLALGEWWQEVSVKKTQGVLDIQDAKHWHQWRVDSWGDVALWGKPNRFFNPLDCHSKVRCTYCTSLSLSLSLSLSITYTHTQLAYP